MFGAEAIINHALPIHHYDSSLADARTPAQVLAQSCHGLIAELWLGAFQRDLDKLDSQGNWRKLWLFWDSQVPLPNRHTAPFWFFMCEPAVDVAAIDPSQPYSFVPPMSLPLQWENLPDSGSDRFLATTSKPIATRMRHRVGPADRRKMYDLPFDSITPVIRMSGRRAEIVLRPDAQRDTLDESLIDDTWRTRKKLQLYVGTAIPIPNCPARIFGPAGMHLKQLTYQGLFTRGIYPGYGRAWMENDSWLIDGENQPIHRMPQQTPGLWFGFTRESRAIFEWAKAYDAMRPHAIKALTNPSSYAGYADHKAEIMKVGRLAGGRGNTMAALTAIELSSLIGLGDR